MRQSHSVREELVACIARYQNEHDEPPAVVSMTLTKYLRLGAEMGSLVRRVGPTRVEWFMSETEKREAARAG